MGVNGRDLGRGKRRRDLKSGGRGSDWKRG